MTEELHNQDSGSVKVEIPETFHGAVALTGRVLDFCHQHILQLPFRRGDYCWHACQALLHFMYDQLESARLFAKGHPDRPTPIIVAVRPIYEGMLSLLFLLRPDSDTERQARGLIFSRFQEWETIQGIQVGPGGQEAYENHLSGEERPHFARRLEISEEAEAHFTPEQRRQLKRGWWNVTWTGMSIRQLAKELEEELEHTFHIPWYGVMSMASHVSPGMIHWSYKLAESQEEHIQHALRCVKNSAQWLDHGSVIMFVCSKRFLESYGVDLPEEAELLHQELATIRRSS